MKENRSIRFINSRYQDLFQIPDGGTIRVVFPDRTFVQKCRYIDDYHTKIGSTVFHICEYAEMLERGGGRCEPEGETYLNQAAWEIDGRGYLLVEKRDYGYSYEVLRKDYSSRVQGSIDQPSKTMNEAREHILETLALDQKTLYVSDGTDSPGHIRTKRSRRCAAEQSVDDESAQPGGVAVKATKVSPYDGSMIHQRRCGHGYELYRSDKGCPE